MFGAIRCGYKGNFLRVAPLLGRVFDAIREAPNVLLVLLLSGSAVLAVIGKYSGTAFEVC